METRPDAPELERIGPYRVVDRLGEGGMGVVHLALDPNGRAVAIKLLRPHIAHDPDARARLGREVETLTRINTPRIASVIDADVMGPRPYIVTRYVPGPPLDEVVSDHGPLPPSQLLHVARGLLEAVRIIHDAGVVHRDIKPGNVLLEEGDPVLIDFGIAHIADDVRVTSTGLVMGTPGYLSPELVAGGQITAATDWWGWAATLTFAASGRSPFGRGPMEAVLARVRQGEPDLDRVDPRLAPLLRAALSPRPQDRPHVDEVMAALERFADGYSAAGPGVPAAPQVPATAVLPSPAPVVPEPVLLPPPPAGWQGEVQAAGSVGDEREGDPRIGLPKRSGTLAAMVVMWLALAATRPTLAAIGFVLWSVAARFSDVAMTALVLRRHERGRRRGDVPRAVVASPWYVVYALGTTVAALVLPLLVLMAVVFAAALVMGTSTGAIPVTDRAVPVALGAVAALAMSWWGPGGIPLRRGSRSVVRGVAPRGVAQQVVLAGLVVIAGALGVWAVAQGGVVSWSPLGSSPLRFFG